MGENYVNPMSGGTIAGGRFTAIPLTELLASGVWSWFSNPRAIYKNGATYFGWTNAAGDTGVSRYDHQSRTVSSFTLHAALEIDDHDNVALEFLPDGRLFAMYSMHNDYTGLRYRVSTNPYDISAWSAEQIVVMTLPVTYSNPRYLSQTGKIYCHTRSGAGGMGTNPMNVRAYDVATGTWDAQRTWLEQSNVRPYVISQGNGVNEIEWFFTDMHPDQGPSSVYHMVMRLDVSGAEKFYKSDDLLITANPITPADATKVYDGSTYNSWVWDILVKDGVRHVLFSKFVSSTDHRYMYAKCVSGVWTTPVEVAAAGRWLYFGQPFYSGGICFDRADPSRAFGSIKIAGVEQWTLSELSTTDGGASWSKLRDITSTVDLNCRPTSPVNASRALRALFWSGAYSTYTSFATKIKGVG